MPCILAYFYKKVKQIFTTRRKPGYFTHLFHRHRPEYIVNRGAEPVHHFHLFQPMSPFVPGTLPGSLNTPPNPANVHAHSGNQQTSICPDFALNALTIFPMEHLNSYPSWLFCIYQRLGLTLH